ncbi:MAG: zinc dependent phospholipase C family protein [Oscillospiraceae bacterium]|nr:zinc dependent phospholipase C family protein [Oscillospiraceae bacterium]
MPTQGGGMEVIMATWVVHLRMADCFLDRIDNINFAEFVAGNVAPDCGYGKKDSIGEFTLPPCVTHWTPTGSKKDCRYKDFYAEYLKDKPKDDAYWFYLGYYVHLLTDIMWSSTIYMPTRITYAEEYARDPEFLKQIKVDWNDLDFKYVRDNPEFRTLEILANKGEVRDYLPYYEKNQLTIQTAYIVRYYRDNMNKSNLDREYTYLSMEKVDEFIESAGDVIEMDLRGKGLM